MVRNWKPYGCGPFAITTTAQPGIWIHWRHDNVFKALADGLTGFIFWDSPTGRNAGLGPNNPPLPRSGPGERALILW